jgi:hypothetical protein
MPPVIQGFHASLRTRPTPEFTPAAWAEFFRADSQEFWRDEQGFSLQYFDQPTFQYNILCHLMPDHGIMLDWTCSNMQTNRLTEAYYSLGDESRLTEFCEVTDEIYMSWGFSLPKAMAWLAVEDFMRNPRVKSSRILWIEDQKVPWPDWMN